MPVFFVLLLLMPVITTGCSARTAYEPPRPEIPETWSTPSAPEGGQGRGDLRNWWTIFNDPVLDSLIGRADASNKDLRLAGARIRESRAEWGAVKSGLYPSVEADGAYTRSEKSRTTGIPVSSEKDLFSAGFDASWEIDLFGAVSNAVKAAEADIAASIEDGRHVRISLFAEITRNYIEVRRLQRQIEITRKSVELQRQMLDLINARFRAGLSSEFDTARAEAALASVESRLPVLSASLRQTIHRLGILTGSNPGQLHDELSVAAAIPVPSAPLPVDIPSAVLRQRPDVRKAEREIASASARAGIAAAELFPRFSLTGSFGFQSAELSELTESDSNFWSFGPRIRWPIFSAGRIRNTIKVQNIREEEALLKYEQTVLKALEDVENSLTAYNFEQERQTPLSKAASANRKAYDMAKELYSKGMTSFTDVLEAERLLLESETGLDSNKAAISENLAALCKALGGGWE